MHSAAMYSKYCRPAVQQPQQRPNPSTEVHQPIPVYSSTGSNPASSNHSFPASSNHSFQSPDSFNSLGYQDSSTQSFVDSDHSFHNQMGCPPHKGEIPTGSLLAVNHMSEQPNVTTPTTNSPAAIPTPSYKLSKVNPLVTSATNFYVAANTLVQVSSGNDQWSSGYWRDNHRAINVLESSLRPGGPTPASNGMLFVRLADVALNDINGHAMYLASNRHRPCYIAFAPDTVLHYNVAELQANGSSGSSVKGGSPQRAPAPQASSNFEPVEFGALQQYLMEDSTRSAPSSASRK